MRTNEERIRLVHARTAVRKRARLHRRQRALDVAWLTACMLLVSICGMRMPELMAHATEGAVTHASGSASLIGDHAALGYILMGLLAFLLGVCVTVLLYRLRRRAEMRREDEDEL